jgi:hemerythrin superfamily protein
MYPTVYRNALDILRQDHRKVKDLFETIEECVDLNEQKEAVDSLLRELRWHARLELEQLYPALKDATRAEHLIDQAQEEHQDMETVMNDLEAMELEDPLFSDKLMELEDKVLHHIQGSESELFPQADETGIDLEELGAGMATLRQRWMQDEAARGFSSGRTVSGRTRHTSFRGRRGP